MIDAIRECKDREHALRCAYITARFYGPTEQRRDIVRPGRPDISYRTYTPDDACEGCDVRPGRLLDTYLEVVR